MEKLSKRLEKAMTERGYRASDLCRETGIAKSLISEYLSERCEPKQSKIYLLAKALNIDEAWLMGYDTDMARRPRGVGTLDATLTVSDPGELTLVSAYRTLNVRDKGRVIEQVCELSELSRLRDMEAASSGGSAGADALRSLAG